MFKRRRPKPLHLRLQDAIWPRMGWERTWRYAHHRLGRMPDTTHSLAGGFAAGAAISFLPLPGSHIIQALLIAVIFRFNKTAALVGTAVGNPWTFPIMWFLAYKLGEAIVKIFGVKQMHDMPSIIDLKAVWSVLMSHPFQLLIPWALGGYILALASWPIFYWVFYAMIRNARAARRRIKVSRARKTARDITEPHE